VVEHFFQISLIKSLNW